MIAGRRPLLGFGPGSFHRIFPLLDQVPDRGVSSWHNDLLQIYFESGAVGLLAYLVLVVAVFRTGFRALHDLKERPEERRLVVALLAAVGTQLVGGLTGVFVVDPLASLLFRYLVALVALLGLRGAGVNRKGERAAAARVRGSVGRAG